MEILFDILSFWKLVTSMPKCANIRIYDYKNSQKANFLFVTFFSVRMSSLSDEISTESVCSPFVGSPPPVAPLPPPPPFSRTAHTSTTNGVQADVVFGGVKADPESDGQRAYKYACGAVP